MADAAQQSKPKRKRNRKPKAKQTPPETSQEIQPVPKRRRRRTSRRKGPGVTTTDFPGVVDYEVSRSRGNGRMRRALGISRGIPEAASEFIHRHCNPCGEMVTFTEHSKVPDGSLPNSTILELREVFIVRSPPAAAASGTVERVPLDGTMWTLTCIHMPMFRHPMILVANMDNAEMSLTDRERLAYLWNHTPGYPYYPNWAPMYSGETVAYWSVVRWSGLQSVTPPSGGQVAAIEQYRITADGVTCFNNTPDLINQGMLCAAQWNTNKGVKVSEETEDTIGASTNLLIYSTVAAVDVGGTLLTRYFIAFQLPFGGFVPDNTTAGSGAVNVPMQPFGQMLSLPAAAGQSGAGGTFTTTVTYTLEQSITVDGTTYASGTVFTVNLTRASAGPLTVLITTPGATADAPVTFRTYTVVAANISAANWNSAIFDQLSVVLEHVDNYQVTTFELPPTTTESIIQSTPKAVYMSMKEQNGWYMVKRVWQPVFNVQNANTYRSTYMAMPGVEIVDEVPFGEPDTFDLNYGMGVVVMTSIPTSCAPAFKMFRDVEIVAGENSPFQLFMKSNGDPYKGAVEVCHSIAMHHPMCYPESYNVLGGLMNLITGALGKIPIIGDVANAVQHIVGGLTKQESAACPPSGNSQNRLLSSNTDELAKTLAQLLGQLGIGR